MLLVLSGLLSALGLWSSWRAFRRSRAIVAGAEPGDDDPLERKLLERELNLEFNLGQRKAGSIILLWCVRYRTVRFTQGD